jgi:hypothetical protein
MSLLTNEVDIEIVLSDGLEPIVISFPAGRVVVDPAAGQAVLSISITQNLNTVPVAIVAAHFAHAAGSSPVITEPTFGKTTIDPGDSTISVTIPFVQNPGEVTVKGKLAIEFAKVV